MKIFKMESESECNEEEKIMLDKDSLMDHMKARFMMEEDEDGCAGKGERVRHHHKDFMDHIKTYAGTKTSVSEDGGEKDDTRTELRTDAARSQDGGGGFECAWCRKKFTQMRYLKSHMKIHYGIKDFHCSKCGKKFLRKCHLLSHVKIHDGVKEFECAHCGKKFLDKSYLRRHIKVHIRRDELAEDKAE